jgi:hypothetical protein
MKKKTTKKSKTSEVREMRSEYDFSGGIRGKHAARYKEGTNIVVIDPDVAKVFPDSVSVNEALRALLPIINRRKRRVGVRRKREA